MVYVLKYVCMYLCVCVCVCVCVCMYVWVYVLCTSVSIYVCIYVCFYVCMYECVCMYVCMCMYVCIYVLCMYVCMYVCMYAYMYVCFNNCPKRCNNIRFIYICKPLYMFRVVSPPNISSSYHCIHSIWHYWNRYCYLLWTLLDGAWQVAVTVWIMPDTVDTVIWAADVGWRYHPKHVGQLADTNKLYIVASCWLIIDTYVCMYVSMHLPSQRLCDEGQNCRWQLEAVWSGEENADSCNSFQQPVLYVFYNAACVPLDHQKQMVEVAC